MADDKPEQRFEEASTSPEPLDLNELGAVSEKGENRILPLAKSV